MSRRETEFCPHCGAGFAAGRLACPECGSDAATGWRSADDIVENSIELPEEDVVRRPRPRWHGLVLVLLVLGFLLWALLGALSVMA